MSLPANIHHNPWDKPCQSIWPVSCMCLKRNLKREPFPQRQEALRAKNTLELLQDLIIKCPQEQQLTPIDLNQLSPESKEALFCQHFLDITTYEDRPSQALFCNPSKAIVITINLENHLCLQAVDYHNDWFGTWNKLIEIDNFFAKHVDYAFSTRFGYLTKNLAECGLGLSARACLHLPLLSANDQELCSILDHSAASKLHLSKHPHFDVLTLKNRYNLGLTEEALIKALHEKAQQLTDKERELREHISQETLEKVKKSIASSLGMLLHGYNLTMQEIQYALSNIKLGLDLKLVTGVTDEELNYLFFQKPLNLFTNSYKDALKNLSLKF